MLENYTIVLAVAAFIQDKQGRILIIKKSPHEAVDAGLWAVPGGKIKPNEPIINGLKREVHEEVGLEITDHKWIGEDVFENNGHWYHGQHFLCKTDNIDVQLEKSLLEYTWITKEEVKTHEFHPNIKKRLSSLLTLKSSA